MAMTKQAKTGLIVAGIAVVAYLAYKWWQNQGGGAGGGSSTGFGTNLNSTMPALVGGGTGPASGISYYAGSVNVSQTQPTGQPAWTGPGHIPRPPHEGGGSKPPPKPKPKPKPKRKPTVKHTRGRTDT
jgi:hypothetical protein